MNRRQRRLQAKKEGKPFKNQTKSTLSSSKEGLRLIFVDGLYIGRFQAMASPCEVLIDGGDGAAAELCIQAAEQEARRVEQKFSRYRSDSIISQINSAEGRPVAIDEETGKLLSYAGECFDLSGGLFDITSGVLRRVWKFDGSHRLPSQASVEELLSFIGWKQVRLEHGSITLPAGAEIDLGGIGKEYAVDRAALIIKQQMLSLKSQRSFLINFGGDIFSSAERANGQPWLVGIEDPLHEEQAIKKLELKSGGLATSGDARRFLLKEGKRYGHILNPITGFPVENAPRSVSVVASSCTEAGVLATVAQLNGENAETFLADQGVKFWSYR